MKNYILLILLIIISCSKKQQHKSEFERFRENYVKNGITYAAAYDVDSLNNRTLSSETFYDKDGYLVKMNFYDINGRLDYIEKYIYSNDHKLSEIKRGEKQDSLITILKRTIDTINNLEFVFEYSNNNLVTKSIYKNDSLGRNLYQEFYKDSKLITTYKFDWYDSLRLREIKGYDTLGKQISRLFQTYENGLISSKIKYDLGKITESETYSYNNHRFKDSIITEVHDEVKVETKIKYENGLISEEITTYKSLTSDYVNTTRTLWEYKKH